MALFYPFEANQGLIFDENLKKKAGRPKGSRNRDKTQVELSPELKRILEMVKKQLKMLQDWLIVRYLVLEGVTPQPILLKEPCL
jgi:hypothetical protein